MARVIVLDLYNEHGHQWTVERPVAKRHEIEAEKAIWLGCASDVEAAGYAYPTITETEEEREAA